MADERNRMLEQLNTDDWQECRQSVLIVDDSAMNRRMLTEILGGRFDTAEATSGEECLHLLEENRDGISIVLLFLAAALFIAYRIPSGKAKIRHFLTVFPFTKSFYDKIAAGRFARGMYLSYQSGMDTYHSLDMIKEIVENEEMAKKIERCKAQTQGQADLPEALASAEIFSNLYSRMVSVGFRSGSMDVVMLQIASHYEEETDRQLSRIVSIIEPTLVIILSLIVGVILLSVLLPLMGIMASIG